MSETQRLEELAYDTQEEYRNVLRQEAYDPYEFEAHCPIHDEYFQMPADCPECGPSEPRAPDFLLDLDPNVEDPPF